MTKLDGEAVDNSFGYLLSATPFPTTPSETRQSNCGAEEFKETLAGLALGPRPHSPSTPSSQVQLSWPGDGIFQNKSSLDMTFAKQESHSRSWTHIDIPNGNNSCVPWDDLSVAALVYEFHLFKKYIAVVRLVLVKCTPMCQKLVTMSSPVRWG